MNSCSESASQLRLGVMLRVTPSLARVRHRLRRGGGRACRSWRRRSLRSTDWSWNRRSSGWVGKSAHSGGRHRVLLQSDLRPQLLQFLPMLWQRLRQLLPMELLRLRQQSSAPVHLRRVLLASMLVLPQQWQLPHRPIRSFMMATPAVFALVLLIGSMQFGSL
jgi:hypothetical protein